MEVKPGPQSELTIPIVEKYLEQIAMWEREGTTQVVGGDGHLVSDWDKKLKGLLVERAKKENPRLLPVIMAGYKAKSDEINPHAKITPIGEQMHGSDLSIIGHTSNSRLWLLENNENTLQTMERLAVLSKDKSLLLIDVYSNPIHPGIVKNPRNDTRSVNVDATDASRVRNLINYVEKHDAEVLGWVSIPEITEERAPSYT